MQPRKGMPTVEARTRLVYTMRARMQHEHNRTILLVEDDRDWQMMLTSLCQGAGFNVVQAFDANAARHLIQSASPLPVLAIVDLKLRNSAPQQDYEGLQLLTALRDRGIYAIIVSGNVPYVMDSLMERPEIRRLVDKEHFATDGGFGSDVFMPWVCDAVAYAEAARHAEGQLPEQQNRLHLLPPPSPSET